MIAIERHWQYRTPLSLALFPWSLLFCLGALLRRQLYRTGLLRRHRLPVPVIVIGNITVGGTGKTPLVVWLAGVLKEAGFRPGIVTRGYRGRSRRWPLPVSPETDAVVAGDEAVLLAQRSRCPVVAGPDRAADARLLVERGCDVVISDDGLQHYRLHRDIEIAMIDGRRRFGNGWCLPAGPLRETVSRLATVDWRVVNGVPLEGELGMELADAGLYRLGETELPLDWSALPPGPVHAVAGIGNPERFFAGLRARGLTVHPHAFPDHHAYTAADIDFGDGLPVLMTEKDAVKCRRFARPQHWVVAVSARPDPRLAPAVRFRLEEIQRGQKAA